VKENMVLATKVYVILHEEKNFLAFNVDFLDSFCIKCEKSNFCITELYFY
jgi:hypothetical protein